MLMIVAHHYSQRTLLYAHPDYSSFSISTLYLQIIGMGGKLAINSFVLLSAYFLCTNTISWIRVLKLYFEILFYSLFGYLLLHIIGVQPLTLSLLLDMCTRPLSSIGNGFIGSFMIFYLLIPFLKFFVNTISANSLKMLIALLSVIYTILPTFNLVKFDCNYVVWFVYLFFIASYIRLHPFPLTESLKFSSFLFFGGLGGICAWMFLCNICGYPQFANWFCMDSNKLLALVSGLGLFLWFKNLKLKNSSFINWIATSSFAVLLIHDHSTGMKTLIWTNIFHSDQYYGSIMLVLNSLFAIVSVYIICVLFDKIRIYFIERPIMNKLSRISKLNHPVFTKS